MKIKLTLATGALVLAGASIPFGQSLTAYAASRNTNNALHLQANDRTQANVDTALGNGTATLTGALHQVSGKLKATPKGASLGNTTTVQSDGSAKGSLNLNQLSENQAIALLRSDVKQAQQAHKDLTNALHQYISAIQSSLTKGDVAGLTLALGGSGAVEGQLHNALQLQSQLQGKINGSGSVSARTLATATSQGKNPVETITQLAKKELAKAKDLEAAATQLTTLAKQIQAQLAQSSTATGPHATSGAGVSIQSNGTTPVGSSTNTSVHNSGSATVQSTGSTLKNNSNSSSTNQEAQQKQGQSSRSQSSTTSPLFAVQADVSGNLNTTVGTSGTQAGLHSSANASGQFRLN